jgi:8-oxo-dGTP pyrophosphatase MutT (NUDIX family)
LNTYSQFLLQVPKLKKMTLPGIKVQLQMAAVERLEEMQKAAMLTNTARKASVMMLLYPIDGITHFALIERTTSTGKHSGQIAFPGGRNEDEDTDNEATAVRETMEEIGVNPQDLEVICPGTPLYIPPSDYMVYSYLAFAKAELSFTPQLSEVQRIIEVPLSQLLDDKNLTTTTLSTTYMQEVTVPCYLLAGEIVWGATAMMLHEFRQMFFTARKG